MKRFVLWLLVVGMATATAFSATEQDKPLTPAQKRKLERQQLEATRSLAVQQAVAAGDFYFMGRDMQLRSLDRFSLRAPYDFVSVKPGLLTVRLPYYTSEHTMGNTWPILDFETKEFTYTVKEQAGVYTVRIDAKDVNDRYTIPTSGQSRSYQLIFTIAGSGSNTMLSVTPNFTGPVTYTGDLTLE